MKIELRIKQRIQLGMILPQTGKMIEMITSRSITNLVALTPEDVKRCEIKDGENGTILWNAQKDTPVEFEFTKEQIQLLKDSVQRLDSNGEVTPKLLPLCELIQAINYE